MKSKGERGKIINETRERERERERGKIIKLYMKSYREERKK